MYNVIVECGRCRLLSTTTSDIAPVLGEVWSDRCRQCIDCPQTVVFWTEHTPTFYETLPMQQQYILLEADQ